jgi:hypothetical protein
MRAVLNPAQESVLHRPATLPDMLAQAAAPAVADAPEDGRPQTNRRRQQ